MRADHDAAEARALAQWRAEAAAQQADRVARAPELVRVWLLDDPKAELIALAARRGIAVKKNATKVQIIALLVADRAWCERTVATSKRLARRMEA